MTTKSCGCTIGTCGCCEGATKITPVSTENRPGLGALHYRAGTHGEFLETMKARIASMEVVAPGADGQTMERFLPLQGLTTRSTSDPAIALLDCWATVGDVLTFYQERIANEGYLRTATERRSILELARLVGYALRPGVASTVFLAYTLEDKQEEKVEIPKGARSQSIPGPDELPQSFETSEKLVARREWNNLQVRLTQPQNITLANALAVQTIHVAGTNTNLKTGDSVLLVFGADGDPAVLRKVAAIQAEFEQQRTALQFQQVEPLTVAAEPLLAQFVTAAKPLITAASTSSGRVVRAADGLLHQVRLGLAPPPATWVFIVERDADGVPFPEVADLFGAFSDQMADLLKSPPSGQPAVVFTDPSKFVTPLLKPAVPQAASGAQLGRNLKLAFQQGSDATAQLLVNFAPQLKRTFYTAWTAANVQTAPPVLQGVFALRVQEALFGSGVPDMAAYNSDGQLLPPSQWQKWPVAGDETDTALFLEQAHEGILTGGYTLIQRPDGSDMVRAVHRVASAAVLQRKAYGISGKTTRIGFAEPWRGSISDLEPLRGVLVYAQSEKLELIEAPVEGDVEGQEIVLDTLYNELTAGRWVIFSGERADIPGVKGVEASELLMISGLRQDYDQALPGDKTRTTLLLATTTAYSYKRDKLKIYGNVVKATHGETRTEILGSGDGALAFQSFVLKQPPLTFVPAPTVAGVESTLQMYVNDVQWHEAASLAGGKSKSRIFTTKTDDESKTAVIFGDGMQGARLPTGVENVRAVYRNGIGKPGNVRAGQVSMLQTRPLGVKEVINPLPASGGADRESRDQARENAPLAVMSLDRLVSLADYADFTRTFAGIGKAAARRVTDGLRQLVHITIAGADDIPIDPASDLYKNLLLALRNFGDPALPIRVESRELVVLVASAKVRLASDYLWDPVVAKIQAAIYDEFGFQKRALGQPALLCELIGLLQNIAGVAYVDVDAFGGVPEKKALPDGSRRLLELNEMSAEVTKIASPSTGEGFTLAQRVDVNLADFENGSLRPAQLAIFSPAVPATLALNQLL